MSLTDNQIAALEKQVVPIAYFAFFDFASAPVRVSNFNTTVTWGGFDWMGVGALGSISEVVESDSIESSPVNFKLNVASAEILALAIGRVEEYRGRPAKLYRCPLDDSYKLIDEPVICWSGVMDMMSLGISDDEGSVVLKCETAAYGLKRQVPLRMNSAQQKQRYPTDTGFDYLRGLIETPAVWLSKKFQQIA